MRERTARRLGWSLWALIVGMVVAGVVWTLVAGVPGGEEFFVVLFPVFVLTYATAGALVASRKPANAIGWIFLGTALVWALSSVGSELARQAVEGRIPIVDWVRFIDWLAAWVFIPGIYAPVTFLLLLFPDGHLPSRRWLPVAWISAAAIILVTFDSAFAPGPMEDAVILRSNPYAIDLPAAWAAVRTISFTLGVLGVVASALALILRFRRSSGERRQQMKWLAYAGIVVAVIFLLTGIGFGVAGDKETLTTFVFPAVIMSALTLVPVATGIAMLRHRLYDVDVVINKTLVYGLLVAFVSVIYVGVVVGLGAVVGTGDNVFLSILATAVIALAFHPARERARRLANRLVYGKRATPYEILSDFGERLAGTYSSEDVLPRLARVVGEGVGAARSRIWLRVGRELRKVGEWPAIGASRPRVSLPGYGLPPFPGDDRAFEVRHQGELLGALTVAMPARESLTPTSEKLLRDLAAHAGLILRNVRLIEELRASRQRIVAAQDQERRRLERDIHDGAQQQLVALAVKLRLVENLAQQDPAKAEAMAAQAKAELQEALDELRDLARGIYPPLLADQGLAAAVEAQAGKMPVPVEVDRNGIGRYPAEVEAGVYFCVLEALQNVAKYAEASRAVVRLWSEDGDLAFAVEDDGRGFDPETTPPGSGLQNMSDRLEALGGRLDVRSSPEEGTAVTGRIPVTGGTPP